MDGLYDKQIVQDKRTGTQFHQNHILVLAVSRLTFIDARGGQKFNDIRMAGQLFLIKINVTRVNYVNLFRYEFAKSPNTVRQFYKIIRTRI